MFCGLLEIAPVRGRISYDEGMLAQVAQTPVELDSGLALLWPVAMVLVLLVVTLVLLRVWWQRRERAQEGHLLHKVEQLQLAPGQQLYVVQAGRQLLLLGSSSAGLQLLTRLPDVEPEAPSMGGVPLSDPHLAHGSEPEVLLVPRVPLYPDPPPSDPGLEGK